jgi:hypothetical protein
MKPKAIQELITYRMEKSREAINAAEIMLENNMLGLNIGRSSITLISLLQTATWWLNISRRQMNFTKRSMRF